MYTIVCYAHAGMDIRLKSDYLPAAYLVAEALSEKWDRVVWIYHGDEQVAAYNSGELRGTGR